MTSDQVQLRASCSEAQESSPDSIWICRGQMWKSDSSGSGGIRAKVLRELRESLVHTGQAKEKLDFYKGISFGK